MRHITLLLLLTIVMASCRHDEILEEPENIPVSDPAILTPDADGYCLQGFYLLNEGNMGSNKCTLDYFDYATGVYTRNIYGKANPDVPMELGDVGNDLAIYGSKLYAVVNCSNKVEVMDAASCRSIGRIDIPNCRHIRFKDGYAYVTSYAGPVEINPNYTQLGYVAKIDTTTLAIVNKCITGYQPDGLDILGDRIYVANSGGYMEPNYDNRLSVVFAPTMGVLKQLTIADNLNLVQADRHGNLWITSRGNYYNRRGLLTCWNANSGEVEHEMELPVQCMALKGDTLFTVGSQFSYVSMATEYVYGMIDVKTGRQISTSFITDDTAGKIKVPYCVAVNPVNEEIYVTDAGNYVTPGWLYCFNKEGKYKWRVRTGDVPAHIAFYAVKK